MVAKSFENFIKVSEPYKENGRMYISVQNPVTNKVRKVRWYAEEEFRRAFPDAKPAEKNDDGLFKNQHIALGFDKGYIHLLKCEMTEEIEEWCKLNKEICYNVYFGWFLPSRYELPEGKPEEVELVKLDWDLVSNGGTALGPKDKVEEVVSSLLYPPSTSEYIGTIGERLDLVLTVVDKKVKETTYGIQNTHIFADEAGNTLGWATTAKSLEVGQTYKMRGTIKAHTSFRNIKTTWLTRCTLA